MKKYIIPIILAVLIIVLIMKGTNNGILDKFETKVNEVKQDFTSDMKQTKSEVKENVATKTEEIKEEVIEKVKPKEDSLLTKCKSDFNYYADISKKKYNVRISILEKEKLSMESLSNTLSFSNIDILTLYFFLEMSA